jgi:hypothetical protein
MEFSLNYRKLIPWAVFSVWIAASASTAFSQSRMIELEVYVEERAPLGTAQDWMEALNKSGADRISVKSGNLAAPIAEEKALGNSTMILVKGIIDRNRLRLPGGTYGINDQAGIAALLKRIRDDGAAVALADKMAFGLTAPQLVELNSQLSAPIDFSTKGASIRDSLTQISQTIGHKFQLDEAATKALAGDDTIAEELRGISAGTAIAIMVRPLGLVLQPERIQGQSAKLAIISSPSSKEHWPIGWPPEQLPVKTAPKLFERLDLEIRGFKLQTTLDAIQKRIEIPLVYDHNSLARAGIDLNEIKVTLVQNKVSYMSAISKLLRQTKPGLIQELRVDEGGKPFLWISTMR